MLAAIATVLASTDEELSEQGHVFATMASLLASIEQ
jgi:hypothetical protein